jgi:hypothetical protein
VTQGYARFRAIVEDGEGGKATGTGTETKAGFADYVERAETRALGRALAALGIGTQFVAADLTESEHIVDAPVVLATGALDISSRAHGQGESVNGDGPLPTQIPTDQQLPCGGALIGDLTPAQLHMLVGKVGLRHLSDPTVAPLLQALEHERATRLTNGQRPQPVPGEATP